MVGYVGVADRAEIDRVETAQQGGSVLRHEGAGGAVMVRPPGQNLYVEGEFAVAPRKRGQCLDPRRDYLLADPVTWDRRDPITAHDLFPPAGWARRRVICQLERESALLGVPRIPS